MDNEKNCVTCGEKHTFTPSLEDRGMTWKEAKFLFIDTKGGQCSSCWSAANNGKRHHTTAPDFQQLTDKALFTKYANNV